MIDQIAKFEFDKSCFIHNIKADQVLGKRDYCY